MAIRRNKPYDLLLLMAVEFLVTVLVFYTAVIMLAQVYGSTKDVILQNIGPGAFQIVYDDPVFALTVMGWLFGILAPATVLEIWGLYKAKRFSFYLGLMVSLMTTVVSIIALLLFGFENLQQTFRFALSAALPLVAIYYLIKAPIQDYLMPSGRKG
ncbi:MAG: hypothetical protein A4E32_00412 [Methanomassiliicoccales archaeon PtaU1.Bin124]|nr:MAG: hypothetical protein A4E32_00412 [Methanomassiliicoccales archaeon PtaU1.Bin124]